MNKRQEELITWAHFYINNIINNGNPEYTLLRVAQLAHSTEGTIGKYVRKIRKGEL